ncbi:MAG: sigma-54 dependent transcriptional regulator [bacterium]
MKKDQANLLVVDDEFAVRDSLFNWFRKDGYAVQAAANANEALKALQETAFDIVLLDIRMPGMDGIALQDHIHKLDPDIVVIMITAFASVDTAVMALKQGAYDYVTKPVDPDELSHLVRRALEQRRLKAENVLLHDTLEELSSFATIVGDSPQMKQVLELIRLVSQTDATVLIRGESGTGKELIARAIHAGSARRYFPIVPVNCGALPDTLIESELFGHEKGAFTGAQYRRKGRLEMADGGTLLLDEVGTISPKTQVDLLRVLETKEFTRIGGQKPIRSDFRVICATNDDLEGLVKTGGFREDLFYRINVFSIVAPPLRERSTDIPQLVDHYLKKFAQQMHKHITEISPEAMARLVSHDWPGNVRELANAIERAMVVGTPPAILLGDLPISDPGREPLVVGDSLAEMEQEHIARVLDQLGWNITRAAAVLKIDRVTLYNKIKKYGLKRADSEDA